MSRRRTLAVGAGVATATALLRRRHPRIPSDPLDPNADPGRGCRQLDRGDRRPAARPPGRSRPDVRAGDLDARRPAPPRPPLLPADARGHRRGDGPHPPADLRLQAGRHRRNVPDGARRQGRRGRRGPAGGRRDRQRGRLRQQGPVPAAARGRDRGRRPRRDRRPARRADRQPRASMPTARTCSTSTIARWPSSTAGSATSAAAASRTTTTTSASTTSCAGSRARSSRSSSRSSC